VDLPQKLIDGAVSAVVPRLVARVTGEDPIAFLDATTSQDLAGLKPGRATLTCLLDDKGRVLAEMRALALKGGTVLLDAEPAAAFGITGWLARVAPLSGCSVEDESPRWTFAPVRGARAALLEDDVNETDDTLTIGVVWGGPGHDVLTTGVLDVDAEIVAADDIEVARIAAGRPRYGVDLDDRTHIAETPLIDRAVSFSKGCYPGQESVARVQNLGRARRHLVGLDIERADAPRAGAIVSQEGAEVGRITSAALWKGHAVAIATIKSEAGPTVMVEGAPATVRAL